MSAEAPSAQKDAQKSEIEGHVRIFDTTLRDGEQSPGASMTLSDKLEIAQALDEMGVDIIEAGFPISSNGDFEAVKAVAGILKNATIAGLCRAGVKDIDRCAEAIKAAPKQRIHTFISTSPIHMKHKLQMEPHQVLDAVTASVAHARKYVEDVEWSAEDATRTERDFLARCIEAAIKAGATTINLPDTVGYSFPAEIEALFRDMIESVPGADAVVFSAHCHNDLGLAVANSIAAVQGGARQIECTINGLGERAGNAALEEIVMALKVRGEALPYHTKNHANLTVCCDKGQIVAVRRPDRWMIKCFGKRQLLCLATVDRDCPYVS
jgi:2-isopropylmalate synthase